MNTSARAVLLLAGLLVFHPAHLTAQVPDFTYLNATADAADIREAGQREGAERAGDSRWSPIAVGGHFLATIVFTPVGGLVAYGITVGGTKRGFGEYTINQELSRAERDAVEAYLDGFKQSYRGRRMARIHRSALTGVAAGTVLFALAALAR